MAGENLASTVLTSMGRGSGVDVIKLARDLTDVTKLPREERLNKAKEASEAEISAHAVLKYNVQLLIDQFNGLNDASELATPTATSSGANQVSITATDGTAKSGLRRFTSIHWPLASVISRIRIHPNSVNQWRQCLSNRCDT